jgi:choice-of-anchor A domain-containing protein
VAGKLLSNYSLDGGTVTISLVDIVKRANPAYAAVGNIYPDDTTTEVEVTVSSTRSGATWSSVANMSIPSVVKGQYAIFANKIMLVDGTRNFIGRWPNAPMSSQKLRVNIGTQADLAFLNATFPWFGSGVWLQGGCQFETEVAGATASDPDSLKATWIYYPYSASGLIVQGAAASQVAAKRMDPADSIRMISPPASPTASSGYTSYTNNFGELIVNASGPLTVVNFSTSDFINAYGIRIVGSGSVICNVPGSSLAFASKTWTYTNGASNANTLLNLNQAQTLNLSGGNTVNILAANAATNFSSGLVTGNLIVGSLTGSGQVNWSQLSGFGGGSVVPAPGVLALTGAGAIAVIRRRRQAGSNLTDASPPR